MNEIPDNFNLTAFIGESKSRLKAILDRLKWSEEFVLEETNVSANPKNKQCKLEHEEPPLPESFTTTNSVTLDVHELRKVAEDENAVIPTKFSELQVNFTRVQKLRIYEHIVQCTGKCTEPEIQDCGEFSEIVAAKKREKKNKRRHRISKPTHIEEVRSLVELQMQSLQQYIENQRATERRQETITRRLNSEQRHHGRMREHDKQRHHHNHRSRSRSRKHKSSNHKRRKSRSSSKERQHQTKYKRRRSRSRSRSREHKYTNKSSRHRQHKAKKKC